MARLAVQRVVIRAADDGVIAFAAVNPVRTSSAIKYVVSRFAIKPVVAGPAIQRVIATAATHGIVARTAGNRIGKGCTGYRIIAGKQEIDEALVVSGADQIEHRNRRGVQPGYIDAGHTVLDQRECGDRARRYLVDSTAGNPITKAGAAEKKAIARIVVKLQCNGGHLESIEIQKTAHIKEREVHPRPGTVEPHHSHVTTSTGYRKQSGRTSCPSTSSAKLPTGPSANKAMMPTSASYATRW